MQIRLGLLAALSVLVVCTIQLYADVPQFFEPYFTTLPGLNAAVDRSSFANMQPNGNVTSTFVYASNGTVSVIDPKTGTVASAFAPLGPTFTGPLSFVPFAFRNNSTADTFFAGPEQPSDAPLTAWALTSPPQKLGESPDEWIRAGGLRIAAADVDADWQPELILSSGPGGPGSIAVVSLTREEQIAWGAFPEADRYTGGFFIAAGDLNRDGKADIVASAESSGRGEVFVYDVVGGAVRMRACGYAYGPDFRGGVRVAVGDVNGDTFPDILTVPTTGVPRVRVFDAHGPRPVVLADFVVSDQPATDNRIGIMFIDGNPRIVTAVDGRIELFEPTREGEIHSVAGFEGFEIPGPIDSRGTFAVYQPEIIAPNRPNGKR